MLFAAEVRFPGCSLSDASIHLTIALDIFFVFPVQEEKKLSTSPWMKPSYPEAAKGKCSYSTSKRGLKSRDDLVGLSEPQAQSFI